MDFVCRLSSTQCHLHWHQYYHQHCVDPGVGNTEQKFEPLFTGKWEKKREKIHSMRQSSTQICFFPVILWMRWSNKESDFVYLHFDRNAKNSYSLSSREHDERKRENASKSHDLDKLLCGRLYQRSKESCEKSRKKNPNLKGKGWTS